MTDNSPPDDTPLSEGASLIEMAADIVAAYVSKNAVQLAELPSLITSVYASLAQLGAPTVEAKVVRLSPAEIRKSIKPDALISFVDGRPYKTLKRHLFKHGLDGASYRAKYGLPHDYPMTSANYASRRSELAKAAGLGQVRRQNAAPEVVAKGETASEPAPKKRGGRPKKAA